MKHGFIKIATATPTVTVANCHANLEEMLKLWEEADAKGVALLVYPELCLCGSTCGDLFHSETLLSSVKRALSDFLRKTRSSHMISIIGLPLVVNNKLYNCAAICQKGVILGVIPQKNIPASEKGRYFTRPADECISISLCSQTVPFGTEQIFVCNETSVFSISVEIGEDFLAPCPPSVRMCEAGANIIAHLTAAPETVTSAAYERTAISAHSARLSCAYLHANAQKGESTTDMVFGGHSLIAECGNILAEKASFSQESLLITEIDAERLARERRISSLFGSASAPTVFFDFPVTDTVLTRPIAKNPFIPSDADELSERCKTILTIQATGLAQRMEKAYAKTCVIGISGGLDSCLAILVAAKAMDLLGRSRSDIIGVTMPCFGTTKRTKSNAEILCRELGTDLRCIPIADSVRQHFADIGHEESNHSVVYENAQARERTQVIMDIANMENGLVVGTGDLSELALGWATYNGDHMSMYGVNGGVPKTLIRLVVNDCACEADKEGKPLLAEALRDILNTPVSPELLPADRDGNIAQKTEDLVGPYEIHDFYLYYMLRYGYAPDKLFRLAKYALGDVYSDEILLKWLKNFVRRFFAQQFKRSCLPDGPKVGSVGFSPRGDWRMPSDASAAEWMRIAESL